MPRYSINLDPFQRPTSTAGDALNNAVAQVTAAIHRRREMEADREERDIDRAERRSERQQMLDRQSRMDALSLDDREYNRKINDRRLTLEEEDRGIRAQDRQLRIERDASQDQRTADRDAIDLFKMNEDLEYRDRQAAERQIQQMNIDDARRETLDVRSQPKRMTYKEARGLALDEAKARAGKDAMGYARPVDPQLVEQLTEQFLDQGGMDDSGGGRLPPPGSRSGVPPAARRAMDLLDGPTAATDEPAPAPAPAAPAVATAAPAGEKSTFMRIAEYLNPIQDTATKVAKFIAPAASSEPAPVADAGQPQDAASVGPNTPDPDPQYIDQMEQLSAASPENFKKILRELKARHPGEYAATVRMLTERENAKRVVSAQ